MTQTFVPLLITWFLSANSLAENIQVPAICDNPGIETNSKTSELCDLINDLSNDQTLTKSKRFLRFGRALTGDVFMRFGRPAYHHRFLRFGKSSPSLAEVLAEALNQLHDNEAKSDVLVRKRRSVEENPETKSNTTGDKLTVEATSTKEQDIEKDKRFKRFMRFGRGSDIPDNEVYDNFADVAKRFMRFGRSPADFEKRFMRFGRDSSLSDGQYSPLYEKRFMRFGRTPTDQNLEKRFMRFGRNSDFTDAQKRFMRFGRAPEVDKRFMRFGKRFMRFGRTPSDEKRFMRFGRNPSNEKRFMRFGRNSAEKRFMRFGK